ncbi:MAG: FAD-dependent oxidoreductase, partial [Lawsonibacter sp.]|nr:FAD-dependent oxidoreductase [Lawsonibacter sp.]
DRYDLIVVGAGPAGLSAAIAAAKAGAHVVVFDENEKPGGQLFKQIHKFFGSKEHKAKIRGFHIGTELLEEAEACHVEVRLQTAVLGIFRNHEVMIKNGQHVEHCKADSIIVATGASESVVPFPGWTLPGVIGAGAAQTMMNLHHVQPGQKILMLGSGNVGLVVSYQLMQAGCEVVALVDAAPRIGGYGVHAAKLARCGVPFFLAHTIVAVEGTDAVTGVTIGQVDSDWQVISGTEKRFEVDTICMAVGLSPMCQLLKTAGCEMKRDSARGGFVPVCDAWGETTVSGVFAAGDVAGIEEASSAMIHGRIAGAAAAHTLGYLSNAEFHTQTVAAERSLAELHQGMFAPGNKGKQILKTEEGIEVSQHLLQTGWLTAEEIENYPGVTHQKGIHPVIECTQNIPCNPCQDACPQKCIRIGSKITALPAVEKNRTCTGCGMCVASCSGQAIFLVNEDYEPGYATVTMPYEFLPLPQKGDVGLALDRSGAVVGEAAVVEVRSAKAFDHTNLLTMKIPVDLANTARFYRGKKEA